MTFPSQPTQLAAALRQFDVATASWLMRALQEDDPVAQRSLAALSLSDHVPHVIGVTGGGGVGKSSLISALITYWRAAKLRVGVLAIDPSSSLSGGAVLGDRVRMLAHAEDQGVFIRSVSARGGAGGVAVVTASLIDVLQHMLCDVIVVETVGVGQSEEAVTALVDTTVLLTIPTTGDEVQAIKAGLIERADLLVLNKADLPGATRAANELRGLGKWHRDGRLPLLPVSALDGTGVTDLVTQLMERGQALTSPKRRFSAVSAIRQVLIAHLDGPLAQWLKTSERGQQLVQSIENGTQTIDTAVPLLLRESAAMMEGAE